MLSTVLRTENFEFHPHAITGVTTVIPRRYVDQRGWLAEVYNQKDFALAGQLPFEQENQSRSEAAGTMRGLHFQVMPQRKHLRVCAGRAFAVAVDLRPTSDSFGRWLGLELSASRGEQLLIEAGFANGVCTLEPGTVIAWQIAGAHRREWERAIRWDDPDLGIAWPWPAGDMIVSDKDAAAPLWRDVLPALLSPDLAPPT